MAQVKIGDDPESIDGASLFEMESRDKVLVLTRVNTSLMEKIKPLHGALVYNTDTACIYLYNGKQWQSLCYGASRPDIAFEENHDGSFTIRNSGGSSLNTADLIGLQGEVGPQGEKGEPGATGPAGADGTAGAQGPKGDKGDIGTNGAQGPAGTDGADGIDGATGPQGEKGELGATGLQGEVGPQGPIGLTGATGAVGPQGEKGGKGDTGPQGPEGDPATDDQTIATDNTPGNISIAGGNVLTINVNDPDSNAANEIQTLSISGNELSISGDGGNTVTFTQSNLAQANLTQGPETRTYDLNNQNLGFTNGNLGIGTTTPTSKLEVAGAFSTPIRSTLVSSSLDENDHTLIMRQKNLLITLPTPASCPGRTYVLVNISTGNNSTHIDYICNRGKPRNDLNRNKSIWLQSDGSIWQQINIQ